MKKRKKQAPKEEKRIYVFLPEKVTVIQGRGRKARPATIHMETGRLAAQGEHVTGFMRGCEYLQMGVGSDILIEPITTINLSVRNSRELDFIETLLQRRVDDLMADSFQDGFRVYDFFDENPDFYGTKDKIRTAVCTTPIEKSMIEDLIGHLELMP